MVRFIEMREPAVLTEVGEASPRHCEMSNDIISHAPRCHGRATYRD